MTALAPDLEITLHLGARTHRYPVVALAAALRVPRELLQQRLVEMLLMTLGEIPPEPALREPTEGANVRNETEIPPQKIQTERTSFTVRTSAATCANGDIGSEATSQAPVLTATYLARRLDDEGYLPSLRALVAETDPVILQAALDEALTIPAERIRRSRGACFTAAVRRRTHPVVSTSSSP